MNKQYTPWVGRGRSPRLTHGVYCLFIQNSGITDLCHETIVVIHSLCCINCIYWDQLWNPLVAIMINTNNKYAFSFHHWPQWVTLQISDLGFFCNWSNHSTNTIGFHRKKVCQQLQYIHIQTKGEIYHSFNIKWHIFVVSDCKCQKHFESCGKEKIEDQ